MRKFFLNVFLVLLLMVTPCWGGIEYDGVDDDVTAPSASLSKDVGTVCLKLTAGMNSSETVGRTLFDSDSTRHAFYRGSSGNVISMYNDGREHNNCPVLWSTGNEFTMCFSYNKTGNVQNAYKDGVLLSSCDGATGSWGSTALGTSIHIGDRFTADNSGWKGEIKETAIWGSVLSAANILIYSTTIVRRIGCQVDPSNLRGVWEMADVPDGESGDGDTLSCICGSNCNDGTGDDGGNNTGLTGLAETKLSGP